MKIFSFLIFSLVLFSIGYGFALADFSSTNFTLENPINIIEGGRATSSSFQYFSNTGQLTGGQSTSTSFAQNAGFLYFPTATSPVVSATPGDAQVVLNWTAAVGIFGNITSYDVGTSTTSGSGYAFTTGGNVLTYTKTPLTNGTPYFFKIRSYAAGLLLSESAEISATPVAPVTPPSGGGGGGGGGGDVAPVTSAVFSGRAYPSSTVVLLKDAQILTSTVADNNANFTISLNSLSAGNYIFSVYSEDSQGNRSSLLTFPVSITAGAGTNIGGIFLAPTLTADKSQVKRGDNITFFGQSTPTSEITISINSEQEIFKKTNSDKNGVYLQVLDSSVLELGDHHAKSKSAKDGQISSYSKAFAFAVADTNIEKEKTLTSIRADLNNDRKVNLIDFSIAAFWYKKTLDAKTIVLEKNKLNGDGKIDLIDFSIMAYYWTG